MRRGRAALRTANLRALDFVIDDALGGGVTRSLRQDMHGTSLSYPMPTIELPGHDAKTERAGCPVDHVTAARANGAAARRAP